MTFGVMWGYPFLTVGQGLSPATAGALMLALAVAGLVYGVTLGTVVARHPYYRSLIAIGIVQTLRYRRRTIRAMVENDPEAYAALRRGVHLSPPT
jgi:hypothetical protein